MEELKENNGISVTKENKDGKSKEDNVITLKYPYDSGEKRIEKLSLCKPTVKHLKAASRFSEHSADQEAALLAILCGYVPEDLDDMHLADFQKLQAKFRSAVS